MIRIPNPFCRLSALVCLLLWSGAALAEHYTVPLFVSAFTSDAAQGRLRVVNPTGESGTVEITAIDDTGFRFSSATFSLNAWAAVEFEPVDFSSGNTAKGLSNDLGIGDGHFRLVLDADIPIELSAYVRAPDGTISAMHDTVRAAALEGSGGYTYDVPIFNPSTEMTLDSRLRLINPGDAAAAVTISGRDDTGATAAGGDVTLMLAAGGARTLTAQQLEAGNTDLTGRLGAGTGKWRLTVSSDQPLEVVNIVASTAGYWNNLSTTAVSGAAPADEAGLNERFVGNSVIYETSSARSTLEAADGNRFTDTVEAGGVTATHMGSYSYRAIGPDAGLLTLDYDQGIQCRTNLYFSSRTSGWFAAHCTGIGHPAEGSWQGGSWFVEDDDGDNGTGEAVETTYGVNDAMPGVPTSGVFVPRIIGVGSVQITGSGTTVSLNNGAYFELDDGTRYTCTTADGCTIVNGTVTAGTVTGRPPGAGEVDRFPSFRTAAAPGNQTYTVGTAIDTLTLPEATGGNGALTYSLSPSVPGLTFNATVRQLTGTPTTAGTHAMTYTVTDEDGDTDTLNFSIDVAESDEGAGAADSFGLDVDGGNGRAVGIVYANERLYVVDSISDKVFAYSESGQRDTTADFDLDDANVLPDGIAYVNERFYVVDRFRQKVYGYTASGQRDAAADFDLDDDSGSADGIAFANGRFYVVDRRDNKVYAYSASGQRDAAADFDLLDDFAFAVGMDFADGRFYIVNSFRDKVYAYTESGRYDAAGDFDLHEDNDRPDGVGYGNDRFYVVDTASDRVYAYAGAPEPQDTSPGFAEDAGPGDLTYTVGTVIDAITLPEASGGDGTLTYSLTPEVSALSFDPDTRQLTGTPSTAGTYAMTYTATDEDGDTATLDFSIAVEESDDGGDNGTGEAVETTYGVNDALPGVPTSGFFSPAVTSGGSVSGSGAGTTITLNNGGYIELNDSTRYTCTSPDGCTIVNGTVTQGTVAGRASGGTMEPEDTSPSFAMDAGPGSHTYTVGTAIDTLTLPEASGGDGTHTYSLSPEVPGLSFNATTRQLTGSPTTADSYFMTYTATDEDGDTDSLNFTIVVNQGASGAATVSRAEFEASAPAGYSAVTLRDSGTVWGVPEKYTSDSSSGTVAYMLLGTMKGCNFANAEADRSSRAYIKTEELGTLSNYESASVCRTTSRTWTSFAGTRMTHLRVYDESSPTNLREYVYDAATGLYDETTSPAPEPDGVAPEEVPPTSGTAGICEVALGRSTAAGGTETVSVALSDALGIGVGTVDAPFVVEARMDDASDFDVYEIALGDAGRLNAVSSSALDMQAVFLTEDCTEVGTVVEDLGVHANVDASNLDFGVFGNLMAGTYYLVVFEWASRIGNYVLGLSFAGDDGVNDTPVIEPVADQEIAPGGTATVDVQITDDPGDAHAIVATSDNEDVATVFLRGSGSSRSLVITTRAAGTATVTLRAVDQQDAVASPVTFEVIVTSPTLAAPALEPGSNDGEIEVTVVTTFRPRETRAYDYQIRVKRPQAPWHTVGCDATTNNSDSTYTGPFSATLGSIPAGLTYEVRYRYRNSSSCNAGSPGPWSAVAEGISSGTAANAAPAFPEGASTDRSVYENVGGGIDVGSPVAALDPDGGRDVLTYSLGGADAGSFRIVPATGQIRTRDGVTYDHEARDTYSVTVEARDVHNETDRISVDIHILDLGSVCASPPRLRLNAGDGALTVRWTPLTEQAGSAAVLGYEVERRDGAGGAWGSRQVIGGRATSNTTYTGLVNGQQYDVRVRPYGDEDACDWSAPVSGIPSTDTAPQDQSDFEDRVPPETRLRNWRFPVPGRFSEMRDGRQLDGSYRYVRNGPDRGTITFEYDEIGRAGCEVSLLFSSLTSGSFLDECEGAGVNVDVDFDIEVPSVSSSSLAPQTMEEFDALVLGQENTLLPGFGFGYWFPARVGTRLGGPVSGFVYQTRTNPGNTGYNAQSNHGRYTYERMGPNSGVLTVRLGCLCPRDDWDDNNGRDSSPDEEWVFELSFLSPDAAEYTVTIYREGQPPLTLNGFIDFKAGDNLSSFPPELLPPGSPPQASGNDLLGIDAATGSTSISIGGDSIQTILVQGEGVRDIAYAPGDWLEPKDGANQRMMIVGTGQTNAPVAAGLEFRSGPAARAGTVLPAASHAGLIALSVVCMQPTKDIPVRGSRLFSQPKSPAGTAQLCQRNCVLAGGDAIQSCVWACVGGLDGATSVTDDIDTGPMRRLLDELGASSASEPIRTGARTGEGDMKSAFSSID